jgi:hypothetical protein
MLKWNIGCQAQIHLGGGHDDLKLGMVVSEFVEAVDAIFWILMSHEL